MITETNSGFEVTEAREVEMLRAIASRVSKADLIADRKACIARRAAEGKASPRAEADVAELELDKYPWQVSRNLSIRLNGNYLSMMA